MNVLERKKKLMEEAKEVGYIGVGLISIFNDTLTVEDIKEYREMMNGLEGIDDETVGSMLKMALKMVVS